MKQKFFCVALFMLMIFSCRQTSTTNNNSSEVTEEISLTLLKVDDVSYPIKDEIKVAQTEKDELKVEYTTKPNDANVNFEPSLVSGKWKLQNILEEQTLKITVSKGKAKKEYVCKVKKTPKVRLLSFSINGNAQDIKEDGSIDCGQTQADSFVVSTTQSPSDASVTFEPALNAGNVWAFGSEEGVKHLKITVKKGSDEVQYNASVKRVGNLGLSIKKITVDGTSKEAGDILSTMSFADCVRGLSNVAVETTPSDAKVAFQDGALLSNKNYEWHLISGENSLKIKVEKDGKEALYTVKLKTSLPAIDVSYSLNNVKSADIENNFEREEKLGNNPLFEAKLNHVNIQLLVQGKLGKVLVNGNNINATPTGHVSAVNEVILLEGREKELEVIIYPKVEAMTKNSARRIKFRAFGNHTKAKAKPKLKIDNSEDLPASFLNKLEDETEAPLYTVYKSPAYLDVQLTGYEKKFLIKEIKINDEVVEPNPASPYIISKEVELKDGEENSIKIEFIPIDERFSEKFSWTFKLATGGKANIPDVELHSINDVLLEDLPKSLTEHLSDGSNPLYEFDGKNAKVIISCGDTGKVKEVDFKIDGEKKETVIPIEDGFDTFAKYTYAIADLKEHNIEIVMQPEDAEQYKPLVYSFRLKNTGNKQKFASSNFYLSINDVPESILPEEVKNHLTDGTNPTYSLDGKKVVMILKLQDEIWLEKIKNVKCKIAAEAEEVVKFKEVTTGNWEAKFSFSLPDKENAHLATMKIIPKNENEYEEFTYSLNLKSTGHLSLMPLVYGINTETVKSGDKKTVEGEKAIIRVQARMEIMQKVVIGEEGKDEAECSVVAMKDNNNQPYWEALREVPLLEGNNTPEKKIVIRVTPMDADLFAPATCNLRITGTKKAPDSAAFKKNKYGEAEIGGEVVEMLEGCDARYYTDYGVKVVRLNAKTVSPEASVKYSVVDLDGNSIGFIGADGKPDPAVLEKTMTNSSGEHVSEDIRLFEDKPTRVLLWVVSKNGQTDAKNGLVLKILNYMELGWAYTKPNKNNSELELEDYESKAWDVVKINKDSIPADGKIHFLFKTLEKYIYPIVADDVAEGQTPLEEAKDLSPTFQYCYTTTLDVSSLKTEPAKELLVQCRIKNSESIPNDLCFVYKIKVKLE